MPCLPEAIMPTIKARKQANGTTRYTAIVRIRRGGAILHRESPHVRSSIRGRQLG